MILHCGIGAVHCMRIIVYTVSMKFYLFIYIFSFLLFGSLCCCCWYLATDKIREVKENRSYNNPFRLIKIYFNERRTKHIFIYTYTSIYTTIYCITN
jgi:hypothetical protein